MVPGTAASASQARRRTGQEATDSIEAPQTPLAFSRAAGTYHTAAPWLAKLQPELADSDGSTELIIDTITATLVGTARESEPK